MNSIVKDTLSITVITLVAGLALGIVQDITAGPIAQEQEKAKQEAYQAVFEDADSFEEFLPDETKQAVDLVTYLDENGYDAQTVDEIMLSRLRVQKDTGEIFSSPWAYRMTEH